jgi:hypothetical protein
MAAPTGSASCQQTSPALMNRRTSRSNRYEGNMSYQTISSSIAITPRRVLPRNVLQLFVAACTLLFGAVDADYVLAQSVSPEQAREIAKEATIYGFPLVDNYRIQYAYFVDQHNREYKAPWNTIASSARVFTPEDKAVQTPNSDTPYSTTGVDLRAEPLVLTVPAVDKGRYYSLQFIDMYTFDFAYVGSRTTGNDPGRFLLAGPNWKGKVPKGIKSVIHSETDLALVLYRTQLFDADDIEKVKSIQAGYKVETLSDYLRKPAPPAAPQIDFIKPLTADEEHNSLRFFSVLNFVFQFCPPNPTETAIRARFAKLGLGIGKTFDPDSLSPEMQKALKDGLADGWAAFAEYKEKEIDTGKTSSSDNFGTRAHLKNNYYARMAGAVLGIYGNAKEEALYPVYLNDANHEKLDGSKKYTLHFAAGELPPVNAFWSVTLYELPSSLLYANPLNRYLINSPMIPSLKRDNDGGLTLYVQHDSPGTDHESNWLPAPAGPFFMAMRLYWPKSAALEGQWKAPALLVAE